MQSILPVQCNELVISELLQQNTKKIKYQTTFGSMQLVGDIRIIAPKSQIPKYRNTFGWMLYVDSIIITICRNGTDHHHHQDQDRPVCLSKSFWNFLEHNTYQTSFLVTGKHTKTSSKYKHDHIVQEGGFMGLHYTSVNLTMIGNVSTTTTSTTLEDIEGVRSVRVYCGLLVVVVVFVAIIYVVIVFVSTTTTSTTLEDIEGVSIVKVELADKVILEMSISNCPSSMSFEMCWHILKRCKQPRKIIVVQWYLSKRLL